MIYFSYALKNFLTFALFVYHFYFALADEGFQLELRGRSYFQPENGQCLQLNQNVIK